MQFSVSKDILSSHIQKVSKVSPVRSTMPILNSIFFELKGNKLSLRATDLEVTMNTEFEVNGVEDGNVAIPNRMITDIVNEIDESEINIQSDTEGSIVLTAGKGKFEIKGRPGEEFPSLPSVKLENSIEIDNKILKRMIQKPIIAISKDEIKPALTGVLFQIRKDKIHSVATDGHRLVYISRSDFSAKDFEGDIIIPAKFLNLILGYIDDEGVTTLNISENHVNVMIDSTAIYSRKIDEKFPDYEAVIPKDNDKILVADVSTFLSVLRRVSIFSNKTTRQVVLNLKKDSAIISAIDEESLSAADEEIPVEYDGDEFRIGFNSDYLKEILRSVDTEKTTIQFKSPINASIILPETQEENEELTMLLMPVRLGD
jgi:DNA polymerase-3 subunit beta